MNSGPKKLWFLNKALIHSPKTGISMASGHTPGGTGEVWVGSKGHIGLYKMLMAAKFTAHCGLSLLSFSVCAFPWHNYSTSTKVWLRRPHFSGKVVSNFHRFSHYSGEMWSAPFPQPRSSPPCVHRASNILPPISWAEKCRLYVCFLNGCEHKYGFLSC